MAIANINTASTNQTLIRNLMIDNYKDLEFLDVPEELKCRRCGRVLIYKNRANCGHHFCHNCKSTLLSSLKTESKCLICRTVITNMVEYDVDVEIKFKNLKIACMNKKHGCLENFLITDLSSHLAHCEFNKERNLPVLLHYKSSLVMDKLEQISMELRQTTKETDFQEVKKLGNEFQSLLSEFKQLNRMIDLQHQFFTMELGVIKCNQKMIETELQKQFNMMETLLTNQPAQPRQSSKPKCTNMLLLGESGSGKSTIINAVASFYRDGDFERAYCSQRDCVIPTKIVVTDQSYKEITIEHTIKDENECLDSNASSTKKCKSYLFGISKTHHLRIIDSSGFASTWGPKHDEQNVTDVVDFLSQYQELHAVAIVIKGNQSTLTTKFEYWLQQILTILSNSSTDNIIFIFSFSNKPGDSLNTLLKGFKKIQSEYGFLKHIEISKNNVFSFENEGFNIATALKNNVVIDENDVKISTSNWNGTKREFERMLQHVQNLPPFDLIEMFNIHSVRSFMAHVISVDELVNRKINRNLHMPEEVLRDLHNEKTLLSDAFEKLVNYIKNHAILPVNFRQESYLNDFKKANNIAEDKLDFFKMANFVNASSSMVSNINFKEIQFLKTILVSKSLNGTKFGLLFYMDNLRNKERFEDVIIEMQSLQN